ncbi:MAG: hypothetical protein IJS32_06805 [Kiritimatiellae bacterium]|nr:hypothetical protein [Kiritimatiellia bacterium]
MKTRVDFVDINPSTLEERRIPCWEWDGEKIVELDGWASQFRRMEWKGRIYTPADGLDFLRILHKTVRGTFVAATEPYEVEG